ncbi:hypothetical protein ACFQE1_07780 [Halobium palmae]|uniref:Transglutaminase-like enzyme, cysteine protease n=1 Tax=Halobium palmae TaxID=1776492 RepID=A0ABD5RZA4_9EURY
MEPKSGSRRRFLRTVALGAVSGLAGCTADCTPLDDHCDVPGGTATLEPTTTSSPLVEDRTPGPLETDWTVALFRGRDAEFRLVDMPDFSRHALPEDPNDPLEVMFHPDSREFRVEVSPTEAVLTVPEVSVRDSLTFSLYVTDANDEWRVKETELDPRTEPPSPEELLADDGDRTDFDDAEPRSRDRGSKFEELTVRFDLSDVELPPVNAAGRAIVSVEHWHPAELGSRLIEVSTNPRLLKEHYFARVELLGDDGPEEVWLNDDGWNPVRYRKPGTENVYVSSHRVGGGLYDGFDSGAGRVFQTVQRFRKTVYTARTTVPERYYREARELHRERGWLNYAEAYRAPKIPHLRTLARRIWDAQTRAGITERRDRLLATANLVQRIPYEVGESEWMPSVTLYRGIGDCSDKSTLFAGLLNCDPYDTRAAYVHCQFNGGPHAALGIDVRDLGYEPGAEPSDWFTFGPSGDQLDRGLPDTAYAFVELTDARGTGFGAPDADSYRMRELFDTITLDAHPELRDRVNP